MVATAIEPEKVQVSPPPKPQRIDLFRWQKYADGEGRLWIITLTFGHDSQNRYGATIELLDVDNERTIDVARPLMEQWIRDGSLRRIDLPIVL